MSEPATDEKLMSEVKSGHIASFEQLFVRYQRPLFNFILRMLGDYHKAQDLFQETFLRVFSRADTYDESFRFRPWVYQIARHLCLEEIRHRRKVEKAPFDERDHDQPVALWERNTPATQLERDEAERLVPQALLHLSAQQREVFLLRENHGLSYEEISEITTLSVSAVKSCLHRARMALRKSLTPYMNSGGVVTKG